jgi:heptosyltransferase-3
MKHQHITKNLIKRYLQYFIDFFVDLYVKYCVKNSDIEISNPKKILFFSLGHLGDALILSYVFPFIRAQYPNSSIDVVVPEWCAPILKNNPFLREVIIHNPFHQNRSKKSILQKIIQQRKSSIQLIKKLKQQEYDISIEGRISFPNGNRLAYKGNVKKRIGFGSGGFGSLLTNEIKFPESYPFHLLEALLKELIIIGIKKQLSDIKPYYNCNIDEKSKFASYLRNIPLPFIILHFETGNPNRKVNTEFLIEIIKKITEKTEFNLVLCGTSKESEKQFEGFMSKIPNVNNRIIYAINKYSLDEFFSLSKYATAAFTLESLPAHFCAINCDTISLFNNGAGALFFPISNKKSIVIHNHYESKDVTNSKNSTNYFVKQIDSITTLNLIDNIIEELNSK